MKMPSPKATFAMLLVAGGLGGCQSLQPEAPAPLLAAAAPPGGAAAGLRVDGNVGSQNASPPPQFTYGTSPGAAGTSAGGATAGGTISLDFADTDIREVAAQILGTQLKVNYTIDPAVHGTITLRTVTPLAPSQLLATLQTLLAQVGATVVQTGSLYQVVPSAAAASLSGGAATGGSIVVPLQFASAENLAKILQPFVANGGKIAADPGRNAMVVTGEPGTRDALVGLVRGFDTDALVGQSYALLPVASGDAKDFASAMQEAFRSQSGGPLSGLVQVVAMPRVNAVLVVTAQPRYLDAARRVYAMVDRARRFDTRSWHVFYLQNSPANDTAYVLQQAFTPDNVTAVPSGQGRAQGGTAGGTALQMNGGSSGGQGAGQGASGGAGAGVPGSSGTVGGTAGGTPATGGAGAAGGGGLPQAGQGGGAAVAALSNPLLGGLDQTASGTGSANAMRIIPNPQNNAVLVYATTQESDTLAAMLRKIDILPLQVRIDATIAEVTLNDNLQYGTQFFFKSGGVNGVLSAAAQTLTGFSTPSSALAATTPGLVVAASGAGIISALQAVTTVHVLSSPQILVLDNQPAQLQVGSLVPYLSQTSQSTTSADAPVISSINYRQTGVIMQVTPRVNSGGLVTLDVAQEVSDVAAATTTPGINSPTFDERNITSRVVVQDGQTIGLAGLIRDNVSRGNSGIPWLKDVPVLGLLAGGQTNTRTRTELIVLITPHVLHDQRDAAALTADLREGLSEAASLADQTGPAMRSGSDDPSAPLRRKLRLER